MRQAQPSGAPGAPWRSRQTHAAPTHRPHPSGSESDGVRVNTVRPLLPRFPCRLISDDAGGSGVARGEFGRTHVPGGEVAAGGSARAVAAARHLGSATLSPARRPPLHARARRAPCSSRRAWRRRSRPSRSSATRRCSRSTTSAATFWSSLAAKRASRSRAFTRSWSASRPWCAVSSSRSATRAVSRLGSTAARGARRPPPRRA